MEEHMEQSRVVGIKQVKKALREGRALEVILADNADPALTEPLEASCREAGVKVTHSGAPARFRSALPARRLSAERISFGPNGIF